MSRAVRRGLAEAALAGAPPVVQGSQGQSLRSAAGCRESP